MRTEDEVKEAIALIHVYHLLSLASPEMLHSPNHIRIEGAYNVLQWMMGDEGINIKIFLRDGVLKVLATDRPESELVPVKMHDFTVKGQSGYLLQFEVVGGKSVGINLDVPEGMFKAVLKRP